MPGRVRVHRPSPEKEGEYKMRILSILNESEEAMTIDEIKSQDMILQPLTSQKMARLISLQKDCIIRSYGTFAVASGIHR